MSQGAISGAALRVAGGCRAGGCTVEPELKIAMAHSALAELYEKEGIRRTEVVKRLTRPNHAMSVMAS